MRNPDLDRAIRRAGGQEAVATALGVTQQAISVWRRRGQVPAKHLDRVAAMSGVPAGRLRGQGAGPPPSAPPPDTAEFVRQAVARRAAEQASAAAPARPMLLTRLEIEELTGKLRRDAQRRVLDAMGVHYGVRPDGSLVVLRVHVEQVLGLAEPKPVEPVKREPQLRLEPRVRP